MAKYTDQHVLEMKFDNSHFEKNVNTSIKTLQSLDKSLALPNAVKGISDVDNAIKKVDFGTMTSGVNKVSMDFKAMEVAAIVVLGNLVNQATNAGKKIAAALTIEPIRTGFQEYETQINAVQTILSNTQKEGATLGQVNQALDELNTYADRTIYNFTEMTRNIGTFTAAGVELDTSVSAIKGIANLAAISGSTSAQASTAMYQLSQALAAGKVSLMDWNSVVNAGMGGQVFQDALKETARVMGINVDGLIAEFGSFRDSLTKGEWLTSEVLTETLAKFTGDLSKEQILAKGYTDAQAESILNMGIMANDAATKVKTFTQLIDTMKEAIQSGWSQSWRIIIGDFEEAKELFTEISDLFGGIIGASSDKKIATLTEGFSTGWDQFLAKGIINEEAYIASITTVAEKYNSEHADMIEANGGFNKSLKTGWLTADIMSEALVELTNNYADMSDEQLKNEGYTRQQVDELVALNTAVSDGSLSVADFTTKMTQLSGREHLIQSLRNIFEALSKPINAAKRGFEAIFSPVTGSQLFEFLKAFEQLTENMIMSNREANGIMRAFRGVFSVIKLITDAGFFVLNKALGLLDGQLFILLGDIGDLLYAFSNWVRTVNIMETNIGKFLYVLGSLGETIKITFLELQKMVSYILTDVMKIDIFPDFTGAADKIKTAIFSIPTAIGKMLDDTKANIDAFNTKLADGLLMDTMLFIVDGIMKIGEVARQVFSYLSTIPWLDLDITEFFDALNVILTTGIGVSLINFMDSLKKSVTGPATTLINSLNKLTNGITDVLDGVRGSLEAYQNNINAQALKNIAIAVAILTASLFVLSMLDEAALGKAVGAITILFADLVAAMAIMTKMSINPTTLFSVSNALIATSVAILILSIALASMSKTMSSFSDKSWDEIVKGLTSLIGILVALNLYINNTSSGNKLITTSIGLVILSYAIDNIISSILKLGFINAETIIKGLGSIMLMLYGLTKFIGSNNNITGLISTSIALYILANALTVMTTSVFRLGMLPFEILVKGLVSIGAILFGLSKFTNSINSGGGLLSTSIGITILSGALWIMTEVLHSLSRISWENLIKSLLGIAGILTILVLAFNSIPTSVIGSAIGIYIISQALTHLADSMLSLQSITWGDLVKSLVGLGIGLGILVVALNLMSGSIGSAVALVIVSYAILQMGEALKYLGNLSWSEILVGLAALSGILLVLGAAAYFLTPVIPSLFSLALAMLAISASIFILGIGLTTIVTAIGALSTVGVAALAAFTSAYTLMVLSFLDLLPTILVRIVEAIDHFGIALIEIIPTLEKLIGDLLKALGRILVDYVPIFVDALFEFIMYALNVLKKYVPDIVAVLIDILVLSFEALITKIPAIITALVKFASALFSGIIDAFGIMDTETIVKALMGVGLIVALVYGFSAIAPMIPAAMLGVLGLGLLIAELTLIMAAVGALAQIPGLDWLINQGGELLELLGSSLGKFVGGFIGGIASGITSQLSDIATDLSDFIVKLKPFLEGLSEVDEGTLNSVNTLVNMILALTAAGLLDTLSKWLGGDASLADLGAQLVPFGRDLKKFSDEVSGIDTEAISRAAEAGLILAEMADAIPNSGGLFQSLFGENDIASFGEQLVSFGKSLLSYSKAVVGIDTESIDLSVEAAKGLVELQNTLPKDGGLFQNLFGSQDIAKFGENLIVFANSIVEYIGIVSGVTPESIQGSIAAGEMLSTLQQSLGSTGGLLSIFSGSTSLKDFGDDIVDFGESIAKYSTEVSGVDAKHISEVIDGITKISGLLTSLVNYDSDTIDAFTYSLSSLGSMAIDAFANEFILSSEQMILAVELMLGYTFNAMIERIDNFNTIGRSSMTEFTAGIEQTYSRIQVGLQTIINKMIFFVQSKQSSFYNAGKYLVIGFAKGITDNIEIAEDAAREMAEAANRAAEAALEIKSPSRVFYRTGNFAVLGFVNSMLDGTSQAYGAGHSMGMAAYDGINNTISTIVDALDSDMNTQPVIRPVLDLTDVRSGFSQLDSEFSRQQAIQVQGSVNSAQNAQNATVATTPGSMTFIQNNNSPKALSRIEIYRQTKNQFSQAKGLVTV